MQKYIIGNLKMNLISQAELERYFKAFKNEIKEKKLENVTAVLCPPSVYLKDFAKELENKKVSIGAQNIFWEKSGSFTGEISSVIVKNIGGEYAIIGHSERRRYFGETNETVNLKIKAAFKARLFSIVCLGETLSERETGLTGKIITDQLQGGLKDVSIANVEKITFVYEPVWAVGTDAVPSSNEIMEIKILIRKILAEKYGLKYSQRAIILYGGSVNPKILNEVYFKPGMDGVLVGRESLNPREFVKIAETAFDQPKIAQASVTTQAVAMASAADGTKRPIKIVNRNYSLLK
ncbi:MAG: triose-phosphate isomerase, partial [bacterium]|nr:triose-phosphate isomerase [bacterium]